MKIPVVFVLFILLAFYDFMKISSIIFYYANKKEIDRRYWGKNKVDIDEYIAMVVIVNIGCILIILKASGII